MVTHLFHYILFLIILCILFFDLSKNNKRYLLIFRLFFILLSFLSAFRYGVGADTPNYMVAFDSIPKINDFVLIDFARFRFNPLYTLTNSVCRYIYDDFIILQILNSFVYFYSLYLLLKTLDLRKFYILFFFYLFTYFIDGCSAMRELFALGFCQFGYYFYLKGKLKITYIFFIIGILFHTGAFVTLIIPLYHYIFNKLNNKTLFLFLVMFIGGISIISLLTSLSKLSILNDGSVDRYLSNEVTSINYLNIIKNLIQIFIFYFTILKFRNKQQLISADII